MKILIIEDENSLRETMIDFMLLPMVSPTVKTIWAPIDGRVFNLSVNFKL